MAGIEESKAGVAAATEKVQAGIQALTQAAMQWDEARTLLANASQGTSRPEAPQALGMLAQALQGLTDIQGSAQASITAMETWNAQI
ncbi:MULTISPECIES: hypothetical protein [Actinokineospora]|uniref:Uncharacterized protein n=1 Tax=Actinokineospora fastidiosa TaxID=1816 RepID=A0A918GDX2_9PSEU|nr:MULTISPECIES: hypothetical protein [Actinokineospora]UVS79945.1 hypothetical protein Actkin_03695 [Actinokineospora sp. UTMC 2448]GGS31958.1 hypothetical protein GCM10010171_27350 [Actinokineospora fastidiosa]